ncbi:MauE/DoxX family redox-associated membrane protein [Actinomadura rifamycini]|uniref:MauE/DoxX family redox-associated membrane protein n=1 Tax=Actinomadura rifamycini TaxID=31962 RepID=UPI0004273DAD|nr:MauE/DoxX family redox-associated membrane protein [Actinomadura rifamycini]
MVTAAQDAQVLLLAAVLLAAGAAKLVFREPVPAAPDHVHGVPVPAGAARVTALRHGRRVSVCLGLGEGVLGLALLLSSHVAVRLATTAVFAAATWVVGELRVRRPDAGCGCFGGLSGKRVGRRSVARAVLLTAVAVAALGAPHTGLDALRGGHVLVGTVFAVELALFAALSPELAAVPVRRLPGARPATPCERRRSPLAETYATLRGSAEWAAHEDAVTSAVPLDVWREGCWRFLAYPARLDGRDVRLVFAVSTAERDRVVRPARVQAERRLSAAL